MAEELRKACKAREVKLTEDLQSSQTLNHKLETQVKDLEDKWTTKKVSTTELKVKLSYFDSRRRIAKERVEVLKAKIKEAQLEVDKAVEDYKKSENFKLEVAEGCIDSHHLGFLDCKKKVAMAFSTLDL